MLTAASLRRLAPVLGWLALGCGPVQPGESQDGSGTTSEPATTGSDTDEDPTTAGPTTTPTTTQSTTQTTTPDDTSSTATSGDTDEPPPAFCPPGPTVQRRLTRAQYLNTVRDLLPGVALPELQLPFDPRVEGFENIADAQDPMPSPLYLDAAKAVAAAAVAAGEPVLGCPSDGGADPDNCGHQFLGLFATLAFRRELTPDDMQQRIDAFDADLAEDGFEAAMQVAIADLLADDKFLHLLEPGGTPVAGQPGVVQIDGFAVASRLSYFLWNTMPDAALFTSAQAGILDTPAGIASEAERLLADPRARAAVAHLGEQWLHMNHLVDGDPDDLPAELRVSMREEATRLFQHVIFDGERTLAELLTTPLAFPDAALAELYEVKPPAQDFAATELDPERRSGLLTRAGWLTIGSRGEAHSPFTRGWRLLDSLFCMQFPPPPPDIDITPPDDLPPDATTRERYDTILAEPACAGCHLPAHRIGYGFEHHDALGTWQDAENGKPVDASGELLADLGADVSGSFDGAQELAKLLAGSRSVHDCAARKHYMYGLGRALVDADACSLGVLQDQFFAAGGDLHALLLAIVGSDGFRHRLAP